jgi:hypothetical protein
MAAEWLQLLEIEREPSAAGLRWRARRSFETREHVAARLFMVAGGHSPEDFFSGDRDAVGLSGST